MKYRIVGKAGLEVSEIGFGAWAIGGHGFGTSDRAADDEVSLKAAERSLELGYNFSDTACVSGHGRSEERRY